jgi:hypothetical protein
VGRVGGWPPEEARDGGVVEGEADSAGRLHGGGRGEQNAGVGFELGGVEAALRRQEAVEAGGAVAGGLVVDDPEAVFSRRVGFRAGVEEAVDTDRSWADRGATFFQPGGERVFAGGGGVGSEQPEAVAVAEELLEGGAGLAGEAVDGGGRKAVGAQEGCDTRGPAGELGEQGGRGVAGGDAGGEDFEEGVDGVAEGAGGEGAFGAGEGRGSGGGAGFAVGESAGAGGEQARGRVEVEGKAL